MEAIAPDAAEVVRFAGGWLFDQAIAGGRATCSPQIMATSGR